jgi:hypothetical protein
MLQNRMKLFVGLGCMIALMIVAGELHVRAQKQSGKMFSEALY